MDYLLPYNVDISIDFELFTADGLDHATSLTFASGDVHVWGKDSHGGSLTSKVTTVVPTAVGPPGHYRLALTAAQCGDDFTLVKIRDQTDPMTWLPRTLKIQHHGKDAVGMAISPRLDVHNLKVDAVLIDGVVDAAIALSDIFEASELVSVAASPSPTTTGFSTNSTLNGGDESYVGRRLLWLETSANEGSYSYIASWNATSGAFTTSKMENVPVAGDQARII